MLRFKLSLLLGGVAATVFASGILKAGADSAPNWFGNVALSLQKEADVPAPPSSQNGNIDCQQTTDGDCIFPTAYGYASPTGSVQLNGSANFNPVISQVDNHPHFMAIPGSNTVITYTSEPAYGLYFYFNDDFSGSITPSSSAGTTQYRINRVPTAKLADAAGNRLPADYKSMSFSQNGDWMVVVDPNVAMLRVNLETFEVTPFASGFNYTIGTNPEIQTAISNDGRYAVVASKTFNSFSVYDLSTCGTVPAAITGPLICQSRDLQVPMRQQVDGYIASTNIRFIDDDTLSLYASSGNPAAPLISKYILSDESGGLHQLEYLALGDSYISGEGALDYQTGTDTDDNQCHVSLLAYPNLLGHDLNFDSYNSVACSGAVTNDIIDTNLSYSGQTVRRIPKKNLISSQIDNIKSNFLPGYIDQLDFVSTYQPKIVTLSVGGDDMGFSNILQNCIEPWEANTCYGTYEDRLELVQTIEKQVFPKLVTTYSSIKAAGPPDMRVYIIGYPEIAKPGGACAVNVHLDEQEIEFSQQLVSYLDSVIQQAAAKAGVNYVDTQHALDGHRLCEAGPGSAAINGLTAGNDFPDIIGGPIGRESYHPTPLGYELLENSILAHTHNLADPMPAPDPNAALPSEAALDILNVPHSGRTMNTAEYDSGISSDVLLKESINNVSIDNAGHLLAPSTNLKAEIRSDPVSLGTYATDTNGDLSAQIVIPDSIPAGFHTLHFYGTDLSNQPVDIYKYVYVIDSPTDLDGDQIPDSSEPCVGVQASGQDIDQDGIDDSCDGTISAPPALISATTQAGSSVTPHTPADSITAYKTGSSPKPPSSAAVSPHVLAAQVTKKPAVTESNQLTAISPAKAPNPKILIAAGAACVWVAVCYAAWKFRA